MRNSGNNVIPSLSKPFIAGRLSDVGVDATGGANQVRVRAYNERLVLSLVRRHGALPKAEIARRTGLSAQTVTVIMRALESEGLLLRGEPQRGRVGQPSIPMSLNPDGVYSIGLKIGRRSAELVLMDFVGIIRLALRESYSCPLPEHLLEFTRCGVRTLVETIPSTQRDRIAGIGIAMPFELWNWAEKLNACRNQMDVWREFDFADRLSIDCAYPIYVENDMTAACRAELTFGTHDHLTDFLYVFIGTFIGGGVVLNHAVVPGRLGNAGALGSMPALDRQGKLSQLIDHASIHVLENMLNRAGIDPAPLWLSPDDWSSIRRPVDRWILSTARHLAFAAVSACAVMDFEAIIIDGALPLDVRAKIAASVEQEFKRFDFQGIRPPAVVEGCVGSAARAIGGACLPLQARFLLDQNVLFKEMS